MQVGLISAFIFLGLSLSGCKSPALIPETQEDLHPARGFPQRVEPLRVAIYLPKEIYTHATMLCSNPMGTIFRWAPVGPDIVGAYTSILPKYVEKAYWSVEFPSRESARQDLDVILVVEDAYGWLRPVGHTKQSSTIFSSTLILGAYTPDGMLLERVTATTSASVPTDNWNSNLSSVTLTAYVEKSAVAIPATANKSLSNLSWESIAKKSAQHRALKTPTDANEIARQLEQCVLSSVCYTYRNAKNMVEHSISTAKGVRFLTGAAKAIGQKWVFNPVESGFEQVASRYLSTLEAPKDPNAGETKNGLIEIVKRD